MPAVDTYLEEAKMARLWFAATGSFPAISPEIKSLLDKLPISLQTGRSSISEIVDSAVVVDRKIEYYQKYLQSIFDQAKELD